MDEQMKSSKKKREKNTGKFAKWRLAILAVCVMLGIILLVFSGIYYWQKGEARKALRHGKDIYLAATVTAVECDGLNTQFLSGKRESGVTREAEASIRELTETPGSFTIFQWDTDKEKERSLVYIEGNYLVYLTYQNPENMEWNVYRLDHLLKHE